MNRTAKIVMVGDWRKEMNTSLGAALSYTYDLAGRSLAEACKHALILMAQSAKKMTPKSPIKRPVAVDVATRAEYVTTYKANGAESRVYKFMFGDPKNGGKGATLKGTWAQAQRIKGRGLASRSWMWGLKSTAAAGREMPGVTRVKTILSATHGGYILIDSLKYLGKIMPSGWKQAVEQLATNRIMKQAQMRLVRKWESSVARHGSAGAANRNPDLAKYFARETP